MKVIYVGPHDRVRLPLPGGLEREAVRLQQIDVPADVAKGLLDQPANWRRPPAAPKTSTKVDDQEVSGDGA